MGQGESALRVHGITNKDVADKPPFSDVAQEIRDFIGKLPIIAHNVPFDKKFLNAEFKRAGVKTLSRNRSHCTMQRFQDFNNGRRRGSNLDEVAAAMGLDRRKGKIHDAVEDANLACQVAGLFYMLDNRIEMPGGKPAPPARSDRLGGDSGIGSQYHESESSIGAVVVIIVVGLLVWWLY